MKTWQEACGIFGRMLELGESNGRAALAVIVHVKGSTYRRSGARLLIEEDGTMIGNVSGGCLEQDMRQVAERVMASGKPEMIHYETGSDEDRAKTLPYERGCVLNYLDYGGMDGWVPIILRRSSPSRRELKAHVQTYDTNMHKPCLAQHAAFLTQIR